MILEAFSQILQREQCESGRAASEILHRWLLDRLTEPMPRDHITRVIQTELRLVDLVGRPSIVSNSPTGEILLNSLYQYCESYERWQFARWLHTAKATAFRKPHG